MDDATRAALETVLAGGHRTAQFAERDGERHPLETLSFFGLRKDMTVVEVWPSGGWYTEILAPVLRESGTYYAAHWPGSSTRSYVPAAIERFTAKMAAAPEVYDEVAMARIGGDDPDNVPDGTADLVLTFRAVHNWMGDGVAQRMFDEMFRVLKPGGMLGVVQHRGDPTVAQDPEAGSGYVTEAWVSALARNAGFEVVASSEVNANPADTRDHPEGVWTLPPNSRLDDTEDGPKYRAIGESDRMTLLFMKIAPAT
jgi:predicted methyltransferase